MFLNPWSQRGVHTVLIPISNWPNPCQFCGKVHIAACYLADYKSVAKHRNKLAKG